ncbi:MAG: LysM peptidoglycan-binding domain-containing protein [Bacilli bacterium]|nr:LysM peptidoglycan-binding domain-containing protein [Bacilli bacterium]
MSNYTIQRGDTLSGIAKKYGTTWQELYAANKDAIGSNPNLIYAGTNLTIPGQQAQQAAPVQATPQPVAQPAAPVKTTQQLATEYANTQTANSANDTQALLAQYEKIAEQQRNALQQSKDLAAQQINAQRDDVMNAYNDNARQAYINKMLGQKSVEQQLSQARLNTSGLVGSAYANVENAYGNNLANLQRSRDDSINNINKQLNESNMQYAIQESKLLGDIENAKLELQKYGNELAYKKYQDALSNYMNFANYDYTKAIDERDFNYQKERDAIKDSQWQKEYELSRQSLAKSKSSGGSSSRSSSKSSGNTLTLGDDNARTTLSSAGQKIYENLGKAASVSYTKLTKDSVADRISKAYENGTIDDIDADILFKKFGIDKS